MSHAEVEQLRARIATMEGRLQRHDDLRAIRDVVGRYGRAIDRDDTSLLASIFHDGAKVDYGFYRGGVRDFLPAIISAARLSDRTWHCAVQIECDFMDDRTADVQSYCIAVGFDPTPPGADAPPPSTLYQGHYFDRFVFRDDRWAIQERTFRVLGAIEIKEAALKGPLASLNRMPSMLALQQCADRR